MSTDAFVSEQQDIVNGPGGDRESVQGYGFMFSDSCQDPGSAVLDVLPLLDVLSRTPDKRVTYDSPASRRLMYGPVFLHLLRLSF